MTADLTSDYIGEPDGVPNKIADAIPRIDRTWSDTNLTRQQFDKSYDRLKCRFCSSILFQVMSTGRYETSARCEGCGAWYIVHTG